MKSCRFSDVEHSRRVMEMEEERRKCGKDNPSLRISPGRVSPSELENLLCERRNMGLIFGAESIYFQDTVQAIQVEKMYPDSDPIRECSSNGVNVLGVRMDWLCSGSMKAGRALLVDETGLVVDVCFEEPVELDVVQILHLPRDGERELHRKTSLAFERADIEMLNPYVSSSRADDKNLTSELWLRYGGETELDFPVHCLIPSSHGTDRIVSEVKSFLRKLKKPGNSEASVVVQPNKGTEGNKVKCFSIDRAINSISELANPENIESAKRTHPLIRYITEFIHPEDDAILREERGNVKFFQRDGRGFRNITFRINTVWDGKGFTAISGYAQVAPSESEFVASRSRGGQIVPLHEALMNIYYSAENRWLRFFSLQKEIDKMKGAAAGALEALNCGLSEKNYLKSAGVDMVLEVGTPLAGVHGVDQPRQRWEDKPCAGTLSPVLLEINPRPSGLAVSLPIPDM